MNEVQTQIGEGLTGDGRRLFMMFAVLVLYPHTSASLPLLVPHGKSTAGNYYVFTRKHKTTNTKKSHEQVGLFPLLSIRLSVPCSLNAHHLMCSLSFSKINNNHDRRFGYSI